MYMDLAPKLLTVPPKNLIVIVDYDKTIADKLDPLNTDHTPLLEEDYINLRDLAARSGRLIIMTARGDKSLKYYLAMYSEKHGRIPNASFLTNSGNLWDKSDDKNAETTILPIEGYTHESMLSVRSNIWQLVDASKSEFEEINVGDKRELCGAIIGKFEGDQNTERFKYFIQRVQYLRDKLPLASQIHFESKFWLEDIQKAGFRIDQALADSLPEGRVVTKGYTDMTPKGMSKGPTTRIVLNHYMYQIYQQTGSEAFILGAGDSNADGPMLEAIAELVPEKNRYLVAVGSDLDIYANDYEVRKGEKLLDMRLMGNGERPVQQFHRLLNAVGRNTMNATLAHEEAREASLGRRVLGIDTSSSVGTQPK